ncbi:MAG TPA: DoxX family protein [Hyphomicrobiaceae bacterium]
MKRHMETAAGVTHALLRVVAGLLFMLHGGQKLFGWFGGIDKNGGTVELASLFGLAGVLELVGGGLIIVGLLTRPVAFLLAGEMAFAYFMAHFPNGFWPIENNGEPAALFSFIFLFLAFNGAGPLSIDAVRTRPDAGVAVPSQPAAGRSPRRAA